MRETLRPFFILGVATIIAFAIFAKKQNVFPPDTAHPADASLEETFARLSAHGNSSCGGAFTNSIDSMPDSERIQGSCCSPMEFHRYTEQVEGLKRYAGIPVIPPDPYDIDAGLAKELREYYDVTLTSEEQREYDYAMANSHEKGPCCCKCWRWYVYGGLGKILIQKYDFTGPQVTDVWNLSDGCGGAGDHVHAA